MAQIPASLFGFGDELTPNFSIFIEGKDASAANPLFEAIRPLIAGVSYEEDEEMAGLFELTVVNQPDVKIGIGSRIDWKAVLDCKAFAEGNAIDLFMGYAGVKQYMGRTEIVKWLPKGGPQGVGEFAVKGFDGRHRMMTGNQFKSKIAKSERTGKATGGGKTIGLEGKSAKGTKGTAQKKRHVFKSMTDDMIVSKIAAKYGFAADCDSPEKGLGKKSGGAGGHYAFAGKKTYDLHKAKDRAEYQAYQAKLKVQGGSSTGKEAKTSSIRRGTSFASRIQTEEQTDWQFLQKLAAINRFDLWVDFDLSNRRWVVHFKKRQDVGNPILSFSYNGEDGSLIEWEGDFSVKDMSNTAEIIYFDKKTKKIELTKIEDQSREENVNFGTSAPGSYVATKTLGVGARVRFTAFGQTLEAISNRPFRNQKDAEGFVKDWLRERERDLVILKGKVIGVETLRPRQIHEMLGMSTRLDGLYRFTQCKHAMIAGQPYAVEFIANKVLDEEITRRKATTKTTVKATPNSVKLIGVKDEYK